MIIDTNYEVSSHESRCTNSIQFSFYFLRYIIASGLFFYDLTPSSSILLVMNKIILLILLQGMPHRRECNIDTYGVQTQRERS